MKTYSNPADVVVSKQPTFLADGTGTGQYALVNHHGDPLPVQSVGKGYEVVQYSDIMDQVINPLFEKGWNVKKCKAYKAGSRAVWSLEHPNLPIPKGLETPGGYDNMKWTLMATAGHGTSAIGFHAFAGRLICTNGMRVTVKGSEFQARVYHTRNAHHHVYNFGRLMEKFEETVKDWTRRASLLTDHVLRNDEITELYNKFYPVPKQRPGGAENIRRTMRDRCKYEAGELRLDPNSAWLVFNSLTYAQQHLSRSKMGAFERFVVGNVAAQGERAFSEVESLVLA